MTTSTYTTASVAVLRLLNTNANVPPSASVTATDTLATDALVRMSFSLNVK